MKLYNKIKWILGILMVFILILATNLIDRNNFIRVKDSVVSIYEDRLIASDLVFKLSRLVNKKEVAIKLSDTVFFNHENDEINSHIQDLILQYEQTKFTPEESTTFKYLKNNFKLLETQEINYVLSNFKNNEHQVELIKTINNNLDDLSKIKINEGRRQMSIGKKATTTVELFTQIEICLLVVLAIVIQIIVMYKPN
ncbi:MCP four helix bundle domain-containing protein [Siansivirga zeaxanthinifaciens]|uniref:Chemotaxis protein n=1 Tax=Siansivirga zeaxanthinifaciens CC-SAMT-1 TaxID=1454006 RepID=A0A0C5WJH2_9FLAO|nr:MCP four helix bundle domain-containing protein [Siansivirga zeaxanthinifaciens]AJR02895.1 chemotaxis protein [Siansivirga zeaxanthinifaciens CC-SAMT-1]